MRWFVLFALLIQSAPVLAAPSGKEIIEKVIRQPAPDQAYVVIKMTVTGGSAGVRQLTSYVKRVGGKARSVIKFQEPADYRGAGILIIEKDDGEIERSIRLQNQKRVRKLPAGSQKGAFLNTDFSYEDLDGKRNIQSDEHTLLREEVWHGQPVYVVETIRAPESGSAYRRLIQWIRKDNYVPVQVEFYVESAEPVKRLVVTEIKQIDGYWVSTQSTMSTLTKGTSTQLEVVKIDFKTPVPDTYFTERFLAE